MRTSFVIGTKSDPADDTAVVITELKRLIAGFQDLEAVMESKTRVLHVATPAGVNRYHLPMGSIIGGGGKQLSHIWFKGTTSKAGKFTRAKDPKGRFVIEGINPHPRFKPGEKVTQGEFYSMQVHSGGKVTIRDFKEKEIEGAVNVDEATALEALNAESAARAIKSNPGKFRRVTNQTRGARPVPAGMKRADYKDFVRYGIIGSKLTDVFVWDDGREHQTGGVAYDIRDKESPGSFKRPRGDDAEAEKEVYIRLEAEGHTKKMVVVDRLRQHIDALTAAAHKNAMGRDQGLASNAGAVLVMRVTGMRPDSEGKVGSYGATTLEVRHIESIDGDTVTFKFLGKNGLNYFEAEDAKLAAVIRKAMRGKAKTARLFPGTDDNKTNLYIARHTEAGMTNKHLRSYRAMEVLRDYAIPSVLAEHGGKKASSEEELHAMGEEVAQYVTDYALYDSDTGLVFRNYADPYAIKPLAPRGAVGLSWVESFVKKVNNSR